MLPITTDSNEQKRCCDEICDCFHNSADCTHLLSPCPLMKTFPVEYHPDVKDLAEKWFGSHDKVVYFAPLRNLRPGVRKAKKRKLSEEDARVEEIKAIFGENRRLFCQTPTDPKMRLVRDIRDKTESKLEGIAAQMKGISMSTSPGRTTTHSIHPDMASCAL